MFEFPEEIQPFLQMNSLAPNIPTLIYKLVKKEEVEYDTLKNIIQNDKGFDRMYKINYRETNLFSEILVNLRFPLVNQFIELLIVNGLTHSQKVYYLDKKKNKVASPVLAYLCRQDEINLDLIRTFLKLDEKTIEENQLFDPIFILITRPIDKLVISTMEVLFSNGANPYQFYNGRPILFYIYNQDPINHEVAEVLLKYGAKCYAEDVLIEYCTKTKLDIDAIKILIENKKDIFENNSEIGEKAISEIYQNSRDPIVIEYLISKGASPDQNTIWEAKENNENIYRIFKNSGFDLIN